MSFRGIPLKKMGKRGVSRVARLKSTDVGLRTDIVLRNEAGEVISEVAATVCAVSCWGQLFSLAIEVLQESYGFIDTSRSAGSSRHDCADCVLRHGIRDRDLNDARSWRLGLPRK